MDRRSLALFVVILAAATDLTDGAVVNIVLPVIQRDLGAADATAAAIASAYTLALAVLLVTGGRLGDVFGHRLLLGLGMAGFVLTSVLCATAPTAGWLVAARALQGVASAVLVPQVLAIIQILYPAEERGRALGLFAAVAGTATLAGPILGALITAADLFGWGWRAVFAINVPLGALVLLGLLVVPGGQRTGSVRDLDLPGTASLAGGLTLLVAPLLWGPGAGWPVWALACLAGAVPTLGALVLRQRRRSRAGAAVVMDPVLFGFRGLRGALAVTGFVYAAVFGLFLTLTLYLQGQLGWSAVTVALVVLPWMLGIPAVSGPASRWLVPRFGRRVLASGLLLMLVGMGALAVALVGGGSGPWAMADGGPVPWALVGGDPSPWALVPGLLVAGAGMGLVVAPVLGLGLAEVPEGLAGSASGLVNNAQHLAGAVGSALLGGLYAAASGGGSMGVVLAGVLVLLAGALVSVRMLPEHTPGVERGR
ncbi:MFS transporter [Nocardiopsis nanhaiensis]